MRSTASNLRRVVAVAALMVSVWSTDVAAAPRERHCVAHVTGQRPDGELVVGELVCTDSADAARRLAGLPEDLSAAQLDAASAQASSTIAIHYDGFGYSGASLTVTGADCAGGYLNLGSDWRNRISSTRNFCPRVVHFDGLNLTGGSEATTGSGGNLSTLNNQAESVQYTV